MEEYIVSARKYRPLNFDAVVGQRALTATLKNAIVSQLKQHTSPEFVNRIDEIVLFNPLSKDVICSIVQLQIQKLTEKLRGNGINISVTPRAIFLLTELSYEPTMGARPVKRCINDNILNTLTQLLLMQSINKELPICIDVQNGELSFSNEQIE